MKKFISMLVLMIVIVVAILYFARDFILKEYLERKMSKVNHAPVMIGSLDLDYFERYIRLKDIKIMSNLHKDEIFISIDELKGYYEIDYAKKIINFDDTEINGITFFKNEKYEYSDEESAVAFENKVTQAEEKFKRDKVLNELKNLYLTKVEEHNLNLQEVFSKNSINKESSEIEKVRESIKNIKESSKKNLNISEVIDEISNIGKNSKKIVKDLDINDLNKSVDENISFEDAVDKTIRNFLNKNRLVLFDLDAYINMYLNLVYEQKIYNLSLKYKDLLDEIHLRKEEDNKLADEDIWELFFSSISVGSNVYGISFNGEVKNFSTRLSKNKDNTEFKLYGEKGDTIGEFKGFINLDRELTASVLNIPEANLKDIENEMFDAGEAMLYQELSTNGYDLQINGSLHFKEMKLNVDKVIETMKIEDEVTKEIIVPILRELNEGTINYSYDTTTRNLQIKTDILEVFDRILNGENSSLKTKIREKIKVDFFNKIAA